MSESVVITKGTDVVNVSIAGQGEVNTGQNVGTGADVFKEKVGADFRYRTIIGGTSITATQNTDDITLDLPQEVATDSAVQFSTVNIDGQTTLSWDNQQKTLTFPTTDVDVRVGQDLHTLVRNTTGATIPKGKVVYITGATGNKKTIALASNSIEIESATVFGVTEQEIANNADGFVIAQGLVTGLATNTLTEGAAIWLDSTPGNVTTTKPVSPEHLVLIGYCVSSSSSNGIIYVKVQNGYELEELHDVLITSVADNEVLAYDSTSELWKNQTAAEAGILTTSATTDEVAEGSTNLYYTDARVSSHLLTMDGSIIPDTDIAYDLGSPTKQWRDVYIGPGSLYVNGKKVIEDDAGTITVETDPDQNLRVKTTGTGVTQVTSATAIQLNATNSADIELTTATGQIELNGDVVIDVTKALTTSTGGTLTVNAGMDLGANTLTATDVIVNGNLTVNGTTTTIDTETLTVADNTIVLNSNYTGSTPTENGGIEVERGTLANKTFVWDETNDKWSIGTETFVAGTVEAALTGDVTGDVTGTVSSLANHTTDNLTEGSNLYYTDARANSAIDARVTKTFVEDLNIDVDGGTY